MYWMQGSRLTIVGTAAAVLLSSTPPVAAQDIRTERLKIVAGDGAKGDWLGCSVAISGVTCIVGAREDDDNGSRSGSAYLFDATTGRQIAKLLPHDGAAYDNFGHSVAISGTRSIVGAIWDEDNGYGSGSAYLFDATTGRQVFKLLPHDGMSRDTFGWSVAISGSTCMVGATGDEDNGTDSGSAYLFDVTTGTQITKLLPDDGAVDDWFGRSVGISGSICIVGAPENDDNGSRSGSAYLFDATTGRQTAKLLPNDGAAYDLFGYSVAISGTTCIVGARWDDANGPLSGSAYLFDATTGRQIAKLLPLDGAADDDFGHSVAISGSAAIVGAHFDSDNGTYSGSAYLFDATTGTQIAKLLPSDGAERDYFGWSVAISERNAIAGARNDDTPTEDAGSAYLFDASGGTPLLTLEFSGNCPGTGAFTVTNATPGGPVAIVHGFGDGPVTVPNFNPCPGTLLNVGSPRLGSRIVSADANGVALLNINLPPAACNQLRVQALDLTTCEVSEVVRP